ncbi:MAG TPA: hypothetical protein VGZ22_11745, partial [Isosphaeraceae bacterium]|nr:hypothetical protein [Isosphaeraceae bacterium]
ARDAGGPGISDSPDRFETTPVDDRTEVHLTIPTHLGLEAVIATRPNVRIRTSCEPLIKKSTGMPFPCCQIRLVVCKVSLDRTNSPDPLILQNVVSSYPAEAVSPSVWLRGCCTPTSIGRAACGAAPERFH